MHKKIKQIITANRDSLAERIDLKEKLWNFLIKHAIITKATKQLIETEGANYEKVSALLDHLEKRTDSDFVNFCKSLVAVEQEFIVKEYFQDALRYAGTSWEEIEFNEQSDSSQPRPPVMPTVEGLNLNVTDSAYKVEVIKSTKEFYNDNKKKAYPVEPKSQGHALIINVKHVSGYDAREGTDIDRNKIKQLLEAMEFTNVTIYNDESVLDAKEIMKKVKGFVTTVLESAKRVALFFLSHGGPGTIYGTDGGEVKIDDLMQCLSPENAPHLAEKPKLMVFQACRGNKREVAPDAPPVKDLVVCFPSQMGYKSWRNTERGSWFIAALVQVFEKHAHCDDILELMKQVAQQVHELAKKNGDSTKYQTPDIEHTLTKKLYFFPGHPEFK